jgi:predicted TIM-barrel fold metal-dependent hydrolase
MIIDFHVHIPSYTQATPSYEKLLADVFGSEEAVREFERHYADPANMAARLREDGVDYAVALAGYTPLAAGYCTNEMVEDYCRGRKELVPFCSFNPFEEQDMPAALRRLHGRGFRGVKLLPSYNHYHLNDARMYPLYAVAQELGMPVLVHTGSSIFRNTRLKYANPIDADDVAVDFPELVILLAHAGRMAWYDEAMMLARLHKNVYIELSGLAVKKLLRLFPDMERFSHKFVFGTDWPQVSAAKNIAAFRALGLSEAAQERILGGNAAKILGIA